MATREQREQVIQHAVRLVRSGNPFIARAKPRSVTEFPYRWAWKGHGTQRQRTDVRRQGQRCRVLVRLPMNSAVVEFEDGFWTITSRNGLRRG